MVLAFLFSACNMSDSKEKITDGYSFIQEGINYNFIAGDL